MSLFTFTIGDKTIRGYRTRDSKEADVIAQRLADERGTCVTTLIDGIASRWAHPRGTTFAPMMYRLRVAGRETGATMYALADAETEARRMASRTRRSVDILSENGKVLATVQP